MKCSTVTSFKKANCLMKSFKLKNKLHLNYKTKKSNIYLKKLLIIFQPIKCEMLVDHLSFLRSRSKLQSGLS